MWLRVIWGLSGMVAAFGQSYKLQTGSGVVEMKAESYVAGVVAGESGVFRSDEALKAMAVAARSYAARMKGRHAKEGFDFCSTTHCQRFVTAPPRAVKAAEATAGQMVWFEGAPAFAVYSKSCGGETENVGAVWPGMEAPYLKAHADPYCSRSWSWSGSSEEIGRALARAGLKVPERMHSVTVVRRTASGRAQMLSLDWELISASTFRFALGRVLGWNTIRSELYTVESSGGQVAFRGSGEGHGVGLCQMGADQMGMDGKSYREILTFYYPGASVGTSARGLQWTELSGEGVKLYTMRPDGDRVVIGMTEAAVRRWREGLPWLVPKNIDVYVYPDLDAFRNSTGEPGWVAGRTQGTKIELQPIEVLRSHDALGSTVEHEVIHCFVESAARPGLPVWFREGLVEYLSGSAHVDAGAVSDGELRQRTDRKTAANGYAAAAGRVAGLVNRYGETAVLTWVTRGLPDEVKNSSASKAAVNNK